MKIKDIVKLKDQKERCYLRCREHEYEEVTDWCEQGPIRWVLRNMFDSGTRCYGNASPRKCLKKQTHKTNLINC